jgi:hypothetical protein
MMQGLQLEDISLRTNIIQSMVAIIETKGESQGLAAIASHLGSLIPVILRNTHIEGSSRSCLVSFPYIEMDWVIMLTLDVPAPSE